MKIKPKAQDPSPARLPARSLASEYNSDDSTSDPDDFYVVAVIEGEPRMFFPE